MSSKEKSSRKTNFHVIDIRWSRTMLADLESRKADADITVTSRKIKNQDMSPPDILFRTHHYEFCLKPNEQFTDWAGKRSRICLDLRLYKKESSTKRKEPASTPSTPTPSPVVPLGKLLQRIACESIWFSNSNSAEKGDSSPRTPTNAFSPFVEALKKMKSQEQAQAAQKIPVLPAPQIKVEEAMLKPPTQINSVPASPVKAALSSALFSPKPPSMISSTRAAKVVSPLLPSSPLPSSASSSSSNTSPESDEDAPSTPTPVSATTPSTLSPFTSPDRPVRSTSPFPKLIAPGIFAEGELQKFKEFTDADEPVVAYSSTINTNQWFINLIWPTEKRPLSWRGEFFFYVSVYVNKDNSSSFNHVMTFVSSQFSIFSKPDVFLKKIKKEAPVEAVPQKPGPIPGKAIKLVSSEDPDTKRDKPVLPKPPSVLPQPAPLSPKKVIPTSLPQPPKIVQHMIPLEQEIKAKTAIVLTPDALTNQSTPAPAAAGHTTSSAPNDAQQASKQEDQGGEAFIQFIQFAHGEKKRAFSNVQTQEDALSPEQAAKKQRV